MPPTRFHGLRHTSASLALAAGVPLKVVSDRLGHSSTGITADLYSHVLPVVAHDAAEAIAALVWLVPQNEKRGDVSASLAQTEAETTEEEENDENCRSGRVPREGLDPPTRGLRFGRTPDREGTDEPGPV